MGSNKKRKEARAKRFGRETLSANVSSSAEVLNTTNLENDSQAPTVADASPVCDPTNQDDKIPDCNEQDRTPAPQSSNRYICFIGNLPFTSTAETVNHHFIKLRPISIRHPTEKDTGRSKGFAFVEFEGFDRMKTCLQRYHHSTFNDSLSPPRKINVELTTGGGGAKSILRRSKLRSKNMKLNAERKRRTLREAELNVSKIEDGQNNSQVSDHVHPSRRKQMQVS